MPEELKLLPCPACSDPKGRMQGGNAVFLVQLDRAWDCGGHWHRVICADCGKRGKGGICGEEAATNWNSGIYEDALPRTLTWTPEPPQVPGFYFAAHVSRDDGSKIVRVIEVFAQEHWRHRDWEERRGKLPCLLALGGGGIGPVSNYARFAGPIPTPLEPTA